jgi:hypothetical protein
MKLNFLTLLFLSFNVFAQDTLHFRDGRIIPAKVDEVGKEEVRYRNAANPTGPVYVFPKSEIHFIKYLSGHVDTFHVAGYTYTLKSLQPEEPKYIPSTYTLNPPEPEKKEKIQIENGIPYVGYSLLTENRALGLIRSVKDTKVQNDMFKLYNEMRSAKKGQVSAGVVALAGGIGFAVGGLYASYFLSIIEEELNPFPLIAGLGIGATLGIGGGVISSALKKKRYKKRMELAWMYNEHLK